MFSLLFFLLSPTPPPLFNARARGNSSRFLHLRVPIVPMVSLTRASLRFAPRGSSSEGSVSFLLNQSEGWWRCFLLAASAAARCERLQIGHEVVRCFAPFPRFPFFGDTRGVARSTKRNSQLCFLSRSAFFFNDFLSASSGAIAAARHLCMSLYAADLGRAAVVRANDPIQLCASARRFPVHDQQHDRRRRCNSL